MSNNAPSSCLLFPLILFQPSLQHSSSSVHSICKSCIFYLHAGSLFLCISLRRMKSQIVSKVWGQHISSSSFLFWKYNQSLQRKICPPPQIEDQSVLHTKPQWTTHFYTHKTESRNISCQPKSLLNDLLCYVNGNHLEVYSPWNVMWLSLP